MDFIEWVGADVSLKILMCLDDPIDLIRVSAVSRSWHNFVIANGLCKQLCIRMFPEASRFSRVREAESMVQPVETRRDVSADWVYLEKEHRVYAYLIHALGSFPRIACISDAMWASSTDNYPEESISNTLDPRDKVGNRGSYWSSRGESDPSISETLIYKLAAKVCVINEIHVHPFQAYFQFNFPIYSAKAVKFHIGHPEVPLKAEDDEKYDFLDFQEFADDKFVWTYTSPEFPMTQENRLQKFRLPEPLLCIGGILKLELLGRVQTQDMDGLYYICIAHVQVLGTPLSQVFDVEMLDERGNCTLIKNDPESTPCSSPGKASEAESSSPSRFHRFSASLRTWEQMILNTFRGAGPLMIEDDDDSDYEYLD